MSATAAAPQNKSAEWINRLRANSEFIPLCVSALARARADWLYGINMTRGFQAAMDAVEEMDDTTKPGPVLETVGKAFIHNVGGAAGPLYGTGFIKAAAVCDEDTNLNVASFEKLLGAAIAGIDKTIALHNHVRPAGGNGRAGQAIRVRRAAGQCCRAKWIPIGVARNADGDGA